MAALTRAAIAVFTLPRIDSVLFSEPSEQTAQQFAEDAVDLVGHPLIAGLEQLGHLRDVLHLFADVTDGSSDGGEVDDRCDDGEEAADDQRCPDHRSGHLGQPYDECRDEQDDGCRGGQSEQDERSYDAPAGLFLIHCGKSLRVVRCVGRLLAAVALLVQFFDLVGHSCTELVYLVAQRIRLLTELVGLLVYEITD